MCEDFEQQAFSPRGQDVGLGLVVLRVKKNISAQRQRRTLYSRKRSTASKVNDIQLNRAR